MSPDGGAAGEECGRLSLLVGFLALSQGHAAAALEQLSSTAAPAQLGPVHAFYLGQAQFYSGDPASAAKTFAKAQKGAPGWLGSRLRARQGEALLAAGEPVKAAPLLEKAAAVDPRPELLWQRALARAAVGNKEGRRADLKALAVRSPAHPYGRAALEQLQALGKGSALGLEDRLARSRALLSAGLAREGLEELNALAASPKGSPAEARLSLARAGAHFALGEEPAGEAALAVAALGPSSVVSEALMMRARRLLRANDNLNARALMAEVARRFPSESAAPDAAYLAAWLDLQAGRFAESVAAFEAFEQSFPGSRKRDEALWFRGLGLVRLGKFTEASLLFQELAALYPRSSLVPQARYWNARAMMLGGKKELPAAVAGFEAVLASHPASLYAQFALERLRELGKSPAPLFPRPPRTLEAKLPVELASALALARVGLFNDAADEAASRLAQVRTSEAALRFGHALQSVGQFGEAHALAARLLWGAAYSAKQPEALALMYPRAFQEPVEREAAARAVDPFLMWAVMRRESAFRPEVSSAADARGLLQIIPPTAAAIAAKLGESPPDPDLLFSPELNIRFAAWYLAALLERFGHPALAAAAYNAGPKAAARWAREKGTLPLDLWVEEIPYKETRGYVKQVVADYFVYQALYGPPGKAQRLPLTLPTQKDGGVDF